MDTIALGRETVNSVLGYLGYRPYVEVWEIISKINTDVRMLNEKKSKDEDQNREKDVCGEV